MWHIFYVNLIQILFKAFNVSHLRTNLINMKHIEDVACACNCEQAVDEVDIWAAGKHDVLVHELFICINFPTKTLLDEEQIPSLKMI